MAQTLEQLNIVRLRMGQEPLAELPNSAPTEVSEEEGKSSTTPSVPENLPKQDTTPAPVTAELTDDAVLKYLQQKGIEVQSFEDLNKPATEADIQAQTEKRENDKLTYGLSKGLFNRKTYESFISDRKNTNDLVFAHYYDESKKEDPTLTDEEIQTEFATKFGLDAEAGTRKHKRGQQEINVLATEILKSKYPKVYDLDKEFDGFESTQNSRKEYEKKILKQTPVYKKDLEDVFTDLKKISTKFSDSEEYEVTVLDDSINEIKNFLSQPEFVAQRINDGYTKDELKDIAFTALLRKNWPVLAKEIANQHLLKNQKGLRGIPPTEKTPTKDTPINNLSDKQKEAFERIFPNREPIAN